MTKRRHPDILRTVTLAELCGAGGFGVAWAVELVEHGVLSPQGAREVDWRFGSDEISAAIRAWRLHRDLGVNAAGAALALSLLEERRRLRSRLRVLEAGG